MRKKNLQNLKLKDRTHFGTTEGTRGPPEVTLKQLTFKPLVFGTFSEISSNVKDFVDMAVKSLEHI